MYGKSRDQAEADEAQWLSQHRVEVDAALDDAEEVEFEIAKPLRVTTSFRMSMEEAESIREAAKNANMSQSEWIRSVCVAASRMSLPRIPLVALPRVEELLRTIDKLRILEAQVEQQTRSILEDVK